MCILSQEDPECNLSNNAPFAERAATPTGGRERGSGRRQTLDRQQDRRRASAPSGEGTIREPFGRLRWGKERWRYATGGSLFHYQKPGGSLFHGHMAPKFV